MASYKHGIEVEELQTPLSAPVEGTAGLQVVFGIAPIHLAEDPAATVNTPIKVNSFEEASRLLGYSSDWETYPMCANMYASFQAYNIAPVIYVNVLDPAKHKKDNVETDVPVTDKQAVYQVKDVLLDTIQVKNEETVLANGTDYLVSREGDYPVITLLSSGTAAEAATLKVQSSSIDPSAVTEADIIGGYNAETGDETGLECLRQVYVLHQMVPGLILAPGWSHKPTVAAVMQAKTRNLNQVFNTFAVIDLDTTRAKVYTKAKEVKDQDGINSERAAALWPMVVLNGQKVYYSAVWAAMTAYVDAQNGDRPYKSPSNELLNISAAVLADGKEVRLDSSQASYLNGDGIVTAVNDDGWKSWGNNTACYPENTDPKDRWICCRRMMNWYEVHFLLQYKEKVDDPYNTRLIENLVDTENLYLNGLTSSGYIAGGQITYDETENTRDEILNGHMIFRTNIAFWTPAEYIKNKIVFDPDILTQAVLGGEN